MTIRSVRYRTRAAAASPSEEVAEIDAKIKAVNSQSHENSRKIALVSAKSGYVGKLEDF